MRREILLSCMFVLTLAGAFTTTASGQFNQPKVNAKAKATVKLVADQEAVIPGKPVLLALPFTVEKEWHLYWRNAGESGMPPSVKWTVPDGFSVGPLQFPLPRRYKTPVGDDFILEGNPTLLAELRVPDNAPTGKDIDITAKVEWLVCRDSCVLEKQTVSLTLPVKAKDAQPALANDTIFRQAKAVIPVPAEKASYLKLTTVASVDKVRPNDEFKVAVVVDVKEGHHIQAHKPLDENFIATDMFPDAIDGLTIGEPQYPQAKVRKVEGIGDVAEYDGRVVIVLPIKANEDLKGEKTTISGILLYQACEEKTGQCFRPEGVEWSVTIPVAGAGTPVKAVNAELFPATTSKPSSPYQSKLEQTQYPTWIWMAFAVLAGLLLNITPCVLPVISIKIVSFVQQAQQSPARVFKLGLTFAAGMIAVFNVLAAMATSAGLVWGQHFQSPAFVIVMTSIIFALALSLFGVFTLGVPRSVEELASRQHQEGYAGSFAKGALATALGTPCLGPILGGVVTWAVTQPAGIVFLAFNMIGIGMAAPYVVLTANPKWLRFVPKPGAWMETFKHVMGFLLMGTVIYLLMIVLGQKGGDGLLWTLVFLLGVAFACWLWGRYVTLERTAGSRMITRLVAIAIVALSWFITMRDSRGVERIAWQPFSEQKLSELTSAGKTVVVDITADWCPNCKYNLKYVLDSEAVSRKMTELGAVPLVADWTARDEQIGDFIEKLAPGASIPLLAIFPAGKPNEPIVLLGILTQSQVIEKLNAAGASTK